MATTTIFPLPRVFQHTAARRRLPFSLFDLVLDGLFQHTAARRRLRAWLPDWSEPVTVSTHSRAEAAAPYLKKQEKSAY